MCRYAVGNIFFFFVYSLTWLWIFSFDVVVVHTNFSSSSFLKFGCNVDLKPYQWTSGLFIMLKSIDFECTLNEFCNIMHWLFGKHWFANFENFNFANVRHFMI